MYKIFMIAAVLSALALSVVAQEKVQRGEVFGGYNFMHLAPSLDANGWNAAISGNLNRWFGVTADFGGIYKNGGHLHTYMFGPTFSGPDETYNSICTRSVWRHLL